MAHAASLAEAGVRDILVPVGNAPETARIPGIRTYAAANLREALDVLKKRSRPEFAKLAYRPVATEKAGGSFEEFEGVPDFSEIAGQERAKRALEIAAAGGHNVLLEGAP